MKSLLLSITLIPFCTLMQGQDKGPDAVTSGKVTYEEKVKLDIKLEGDVAQFSDMLPKERKSEKVLLFTKEATLFQDGLNTDDAMQTTQSEGVVIRMVGSGGQNKLFTDLKNNKVIDQKDFMNRMFLVEKEIPELYWKVTGNQKQILGYTCIEAIKTDTAGTKVVVWFAPAIDIKAGPAGLGNLPGLILEADVNNGSIIYSAKSVEPIAAKELKLEKPRDGKRVSDSEYKIIVAEKMKEMGMEAGESGSGTTHMRIVIKQ